MCLYSVMSALVNAISIYATDWAKKYDVDFDISFLLDLFPGIKNITSLVIIFDSEGKKVSMFKVEGKSNFYCFDEINFMDILQNLPGLTFYTIPFHTYGTV